MSIAYQVIGDADRDLVLVPGFVSHLEIAWLEPGYARFLERLARFSRLIMFDKRGTGLSDRVAASELPTLEERMGVASAAGAGQILVTSTIRDLVGGSGLTFREIGSRSLKGVPGSWLLLEVLC